MDRLAHDRGLTPSACTASDVIQSQGMSERPSDAETRNERAGAAKQLTGEPLYESILHGGARVGNYIIDAARSQGGFATVYRARHRVLNRVAAVKVLHASLATEEAIQRFTQEAQAVNLIHHPNIVDVYEFGKLLDGRPYLVMEWLEGRNLDEELESRGPLSPAEALAVMEELGAGLSAAHAQGVIHRDLKASNVIAVSSGAWFSIKLVDFGIAKLLEPAKLNAVELTSTAGLRLGTPWNMAPEQILGKPVDARTDIYALGILLYQLLTGGLPFRADTPVEAQEQQLHSPPPRASDLAAIGEALDDVIHRAMEKEIDRRFDSVEQFLASLRRAVAADTTGARQPQRSRSADDHAKTARPASPRRIATESIGPGTYINDYRVRRLIAKGGFGTVYHVEHILLGRDAALKVLHAELAATPESIKRFEREARAANLIRHPNVVDIYEFGELPDGRPFFVMELLEGSDLASYIRARRRLSPEETLQVLEPLCNALAAAHRKGIVHRDVKAANVFVAQRDGRRRIVLLDFGVAKLLAPSDGSVTTSKRLIGTPACMAPEQLTFGLVDARTDVYALGALTFHMLTGALPFSAQNETVTKHLQLHGDRPRPSALVRLGPLVDAAVSRAMAIAPDDRFAGALEFFETLHRAIEGRDAETAHARRVLGLYIDIHVDAEALEHADERMLAEIDSILRVSVERLTSSGFRVALEAGTALLLFRVMPAEAEVVVRQECVEQAVALEAELRHRSDGDDRVHVSLCLHVADALVAQNKVRGGELMRLASWVPSRAIAGVVGTRAAFDGLAVRLEDEGELQRYVAWTGR
jgi:serine/threonine protein kinase